MKILAIFLFISTIVPTDQKIPFHIFRDIVNNQTVVSYCPLEMRHVLGQFCTQVVQNCIKYVDPPTNKFARCQEFFKTSCIGNKIEMNFCIDVEEHYDHSSLKPINDLTYEDAVMGCSQEGKKICTEDQWTFACEGEEMFPYTTGYIRPSDKCNFDKDSVSTDGNFLNQAETIDQNLKCMSPFGIHNMNGNVDEWVSLKHPFVKKDNMMWSGLKGGWWGGLRNRCRPVTVGHGGLYHDVQIGYRCCQDLQ